MPKTDRETLRRTTPCFTEELFDKLGFPTVPFKVTAELIEALELHVDLYPDDKDNQSIRLLIGELDMTLHGPCDGPEEGYEFFTRQNRNR